MKPSKANLEQSYFLQKRTIFIIIITLISTSFIYLLARNIPSRMVNGNHGRVAIKTLDEVRRPLLDIHRTESFLLSDGYSKTIHESLKHGIDRGRHLIADFKTVSAYNPELLERVEKLASTFEEWIKTEQVLFNQSAGNGSNNFGLMSNVENLNIIAGTSKYFSNTMDNLGDAEVPLHNDIQEGSLAVTEMIIVGGTLLVVLMSMVFFLQWFKNKKLRELFIINIQTEKRLQAIIDNTIAVIYLKDTQGRYLLINHQYERLFHINKKEIIGKTDYEIFPEDKADLFLENDRKVLDAMAPLEFEEVVPHDDGLHTYISLKFPLLDTENIAYGVCGISTDITERKLFEKKITSVANILEESLNEIYIFDAKTLRFIQVNEGARLNLGYSMEELSNLTPLDLKPEFTVESFAKLVEPLRVGEKQKIQFTTVHQRKDSSLYNVEVHLQFSTFQSVPAFVAIILDITERKKSEAMLQKLFHAVEQSPSVVVVTDNKSNIEYVNPKFSQLTGYTSEEAIGNNPNVLKSGKTAPEVYKNLWETITSGNEWRGEFCNKKKNGELYFESASISSIKDTEGVITHFIAVKEDITKRKQVEKKLEENEAKLRSIVSSLYESAIVVYDRDGKIMELYGTPEMDKRYGIHWVDAVGRSIGEFLPPEQIEQRLAEIRRIFDTGEKMIVENVMIFPSGNFWHETSLSPMKDSSCNILAVVGFIRDITERKEVEEQLMSVRESLQKQANHDKLTGLFNRHYMSGILDKEFSRALRYQTDLSCLLLDLDYFKDVNDTFGHAFGDMVLREFSDCLKQNARKTDISFRYGGEEFMLLLPNTGIDGARNVAEKIRAVCDKKRYVYGNQSTTVTVSIGIASVKQHQLLKSKDILALADKALYHAKAEGRNRVIVYMKDASEQSAGKKTSEDNNFRYLKEKLSVILGKTKKSSIESLELLTRDMCGEEHKQRNHDLRRYIRLIGEKLGLPPTIIETFKRAANFHDNFKILMGKTFIDKNKVFSRKEKIEIEDHPYILSELIELFDFFANEKSILLYHHENFDGTGYPGGLKDNEIPLGARIFALTDAITSMLSERQYKPKLSPEEMVVELADKAGTQFDPMLVSLFIDIIKTQELFPVPVGVLEKAREKVAVRKYS